jgi:hypothetical protein
MRRMVSMLGRAWQQTAPRQQHSRGPITAMHTLLSISTPCYGVHELQLAQHQLLLSAGKQLCRLRSASSALYLSTIASRAVYLRVLLQQCIHQPSQLRAVPAGQRRVAAPQDLDHQRWQAASVKRTPQASQLIQHTACSGARVTQRNSSAVSTLGVEQSACSV